MTMPGSRGSREHTKFVETDGGDTSHRTHIYGITSAGAIIPVLVDTDGKLIITV